MLDIESDSLFFRTSIFDVIDHKKQGHLFYHSLTSGKKWHFTKI